MNQKVLNASKFPVRYSLIHRLVNHPED